MITREIEKCTTGRLKYSTGRGGIRRRLKRSLFNFRCIRTRKICAGVFVSCTYKKDSCRLAVHVRCAYAAAQRPVTRCLGENIYPLSLLSSTSSEDEIYIEILSILFSVLRNRLLILIFIFTPFVDCIHNMFTSFILVETSELF